jgi:hypothetical protein
MQINNTLLHNQRQKMSQRKKDLGTMKTKTQYTKIYSHSETKNTAQRQICMTLHLCFKKMISSHQK